MASGTRTMVILVNTPFLLATVAAASALSMVPSRSEACQPPDLIGRVKSVIVSEVIVDPPTGRIEGVRQVLRTDFSEDGKLAKTTLASSRRSAGPPATSTTHFENGRPVRGFETVNGKTVPSMSCSYDSQGRLVEAITGSENSEFLITESYQYDAGVIRRRTSSIPGGGPTVATQTLDGNGRVIKEVETDEATLTVRRTIEITYDGNRTEACVVSSFASSRDCSTTVQDARGNEIEFVQRDSKRTSTFVYDSVGNWISKRIAITRFPGVGIVTIQQRKIEYW